MNYLAHFYLSGGSEGAVIGNFIADFVKGKKYLDYPSDISKGILQHREIDRYTDSHPLVQETKNRLYPAYRKYAAVVADIYYDHILAANWQEHSGTELKNYAENIYGILTKNYAQLPASAQYTLKYMVQHNWLLSYATFQGIERTLYGLSRRTSFPSNIEKSGVELKRDYALIKQEFDSFLPDIQQHLQSF